MEAARIAAMRGHNVTLYEKRSLLGYMLAFAATVKGPHENFADLRKYLIHQLEITGVTVRTGIEVTKEFIETEAPDAVILAVGGRRDTLAVNGNCPVIDMNRFMSAGTGDNIIICGSNAQAFDAALWLTVHKKRVTMVTPNTADDFDIQQSQHARRMITTVLYSLGFNALPESAIRSVRDGMATVMTDTGLETRIPCDAIINAADMRPNLDLIDGISVKEIYAVGDCASPFNIAQAIRSGNDAGRAV